MMATLEKIQHPSHYTHGGIECIDVIRAMTADKEGIEAVYAGNICKYIYRCKHKDGLQDLQKAREYLELWISEWERQEQDNGYS